jgi:hypothetical protein
MHEFICCEELPSHGLLAADLSPHTNTLLFGPLYVSLDPRHVKSSSLTLSCKSQATLLDVMTSGAIGSMAMAPLANLRGLGPALTAVAQGEAAGGNGGESTQQTSQSHALKQRIAVALNSPAVNIDTCLVRYYIYINILMVLCCITQNSTPLLILIVRQLLAVYGHAGRRAGLLRQ